MERIDAVHRLPLAARAGCAFIEGVANAAAAAAAAGLIRRRWLRLRAERASARTRNELHALSDHLLRDIGLDRRNIDSHFR